MKNLHIKKGEFIYLSNRRNDTDCYKLLLLEFDEKSQNVDVGIFDCTECSDPDMQSIKFSFGKRQELFNNMVTINALKSDNNGINFAVSASALFTIENDFIRNRYRHPKRYVKTRKSP